MMFFALLLGLSTLFNASTIDVEAQGNCGAGYWVHDGGGHWLVVLNKCAIEMTVS